MISSSGSKDITNPSRTNKKPFFTLRSLIILDVVLFGVFAWVLYADYTDTSGWSGLITAPVSFLDFIAMIVVAFGFVVLAKRVGRWNKKRTLSLLAALLSLMPLIGTITLLSIGDQLQRQAQDRATTPISQSEARQLIMTCKVDTIYREDSGEMQLKENAPKLPWERPYAERRKFDVRYFDELLALARSKSVQGKCGFIPSYDSERPKKPAVNSWITEQEAASILDKCAESTRFYTDARYFPGLELPQPNTTGILLSQRLNVWNDETDKTIILVNVDNATKSALEAKGCY